MKKKTFKEYILHYSTCFIVTHLIMEYTFITKDTFNGIIENYITKLPVSKEKKTFIDLNFLNEIKEILLNPIDKTISSKNTRNWAKRKSSS